MSNTEGNSVDQSPDELFEQAMGIADREAQERAAWQRVRLEVRVGDSYREFFKALRDYGIIYEPGQAQKFEIPLDGQMHSVWIEIPS